MVGKDLVTQVKTSKILGITHGIIIIYVFPLTFLHLNQHVRIYHYKSNNTKDI